MNITDKEYLQRLKEQFAFLQSEFSEYESGRAEFAIKMAATLRTIFHSTESSTAILPQLTDKYNISITFLGRQQPKFDQYDALYVGFQIGSTGRPLLDAPFYVHKNFKDYWNEVIYLEGKYSYTRKDAVLLEANKLGGSHVDPRIEKSKDIYILYGGTKLISKKYGEEIITNRVVYEMAFQVLEILNKTIPKLEEAIK